jgi:hypothetical protein
MNVILQHYNWADVCVALLLFSVFAFRVAPLKMAKTVRWGWAALKLLVAIPLLPLLYLLFRTSKRAFLPVFTFLWPHRDIVKKGQGLYLRRFYLTPRFKGRKRYFLHYIRRDDVDRDGHNHPWDFASEILDGGYVEQVFFPRDWEYPRKNAGLRYEFRHRRRGDKFFNPAEHTHKVTLTGPTWTLVTAWPARQEWGFWKMGTNPAADEWVNWKTYVNAGKDQDSWKEDRP